MTRAVLILALCAVSAIAAPPIPLQGGWTADNGGLPPWKGDCHNDLNTQMTHIAYQVAGQFDEGRRYLDFLSRLSPVFTRFARLYYLHWRYTADDRFLREQACPWCKAAAPANAAKPVVTGKP